MANPTSKLNLVINGTTTQLDIHDANAVDLTSNQTVGGIKTFSNAPVVNSINLDGKTIDTDANGNLAFNGHIIDTIEEQGNGYIRYSNGLQICWGTLTWQDTCSNEWGSLYETSPKAGSYARSFVAVPSVQALGAIGTFSAIMEIIVAPSTTTTPTFYLCRGTPVTEQTTCIVNYMAIGLWK